MEFFLSLNFNKNNENIIWLFNRKSVVIINTYVLYTKRASFSNFFLGTFMKFSSAEEIDGRIIHFPDGETEHQDG